MAEIVFSKDNKRVVRLSSFYDEDDIIELIAQFTTHRAHLTRMRDDTAPEIFHIHAQDMDTLAEEWMAFRADQTAKFEAIQKKNEDARIAEEKRMEAVKEEAYSLAYKHSIIIEKLGNESYYLLLPDGKKTKSTQTFDGVLRSINIVVGHAEKKVASLADDAPQVL